MQVLDFELQRQLVPYMKEFTPLPGIYDPDFIAANQDTRADSVISGSKKDQLETVRRDIRTFKEQSKVCEPHVPAPPHLEDGYLPGHSWGFQRQAATRR